MIFIVGLYNYQLWIQEFDVFCKTCMISRRVSELFRIPADEWDPPIDFRGKSLAEIERYTNRTLPTYKYFLPDEDFGMEFQFDSEVISKNSAHPLISFYPG